MKKDIILQSLNIDPAIWFLGTEAEQAEAANREAVQAAIIEKIIFSPDFIQMNYKTEYGQIRSLHLSTRQGVLYQLSYIDRDGIPAMHENYIKISRNAVDEAIHGPEDLTRHYIRETLQKPLKLELITV